MILGYSISARVALDCSDAGTLVAECTIRSEMAMPLSAGLCARSDIKFILRRLTVLMHSSLSVCVASGASQSSMCVCDAAELFRGSIYSEIKWSSYKNNSWRARMIRFSAEILCIFVYLALR